MADGNLKSIPITNLDATPAIVATVGEGLPGHVRAATDEIFPTSAVARWDTYRLARMPTTAKVKHVWLYLKGIDTNGTATATFDVNIAFSSDTNDGTPVVLQGTVPSNQRDGTSIAFVTGTGYSTAYASSGTGNKLFGNTAGSAAGAAQFTDITFKGGTVVGAFVPANREDDLWNVQGFVNSQSIAQDPGGFFDIFVVVQAAVATAAAGTIGVEVDYVG